MRNVFSEAAYILSLYKKIHLVIVYNAPNEELEDFVRGFNDYLRGLRADESLRFDNGKRGEISVKFGNIQPKVKFLDDIALESEIDEVDLHRKNGSPNAVAILCLKNKESLEKEFYNTGKIYTIDIKALRDNYS
ncbi:MAG: hypothetical protein AABW52_01465 [Nanoarchaeota archaeon]